MTNTQARMISVSALVRKSAVNSANGTDTIHARLIGGAR